MEKVIDNKGFKLILIFKEVNDICANDKNHKQKEKVMKLTKVCNKMVEKAKNTGDESFVRGVIYGIPVEEKVGGFEVKHKRWRSYWH